MRAVSLAVLILLLTGCAQKYAAPEVLPKEPVPEESPAAQPEGAIDEAAQPPQEADVAEDVSAEIREVESLQQELDDSELADLDKDLAEISW